MNILLAGGGTAATEAGDHASAFPVTAILLVGVAFVVVLIIAAFATGFIGRAGRDVGDETDEIEPIAGGIAVGNAGPPKWIYLVYAVIPVWAAIYIVANTNLPEPKAEPAATPHEAEATAAPTSAGAVSITAKALAFDKKALSLKASTAAVINFNNDEAILHNVAIYADSTAKSKIFVGELITGPRKTAYKFTAPGAGSYYFQCDVHPTMNGTVTVA